MKTFTVCHKGFGYITHSYVIADTLVKAQELAVIEYDNVLSVMALNG